MQPKKNTYVSEAEIMTPLKEALLVEIRPNSLEYEINNTEIVF